MQWPLTLTNRPQLLEMTTLENEGKQRLAFLCPSRGLIGFRPAFATLTRGSGLMHRAFHEYGPYRGHMDRVRKGVLVSMAGAVLCEEARAFSVLKPGQSVRSGLLSLYGQAASFRRLLFA